MEIRLINKKDYAFLLELDKKVYPTDSPVTKEVIEQWYQNNPEFGFIFHEKEKIKGVCVGIPLNKNGWEKLISGNLLESELDSKTIFNNSRDSELGIHIYHLEKFNEPKIKIYEESLKQLSKIIDKLRLKNPELKIIGFSGLAVTVQGISLLYNKLNCRERKFLNDEHIFKKQGKLKIFKINSLNELLEKLKEDYEYVNRCKMLVLYPDETSIVWKYLR
jgi:hypothetical protein